MAPKKRALMTEEEKEAARAKDKKRRLQKKANMTEEEREAIRDKDNKRRLQKRAQDREAVRAKDRERRLQRKANMTEEEKETIRAKDRERSMKKRADMTEEDKRKQREKRAIRVAQIRASMTEEEKRKEKEKTAIRMAQKRAIITGEDRQAVRVKDKIRGMKKRAKKRETVRVKERKRYLQKRANERETVRTKGRKRSLKNRATEREAIRAKDRERYLQKKANMTEEEIEEQRAKDKERHLQRKANMTEEQKQKQRAKWTKRYTLFRAADKLLDDRSSLPCMTPVQRVKTLISRVTIRTASIKKYEPARACIKNSFLEILSLHEELGQLKMQLQKTLAEAVASAVKFRIGEKCKPTELHASTFVEIPISLAADKITTFKNLDDPLLLQTEKEFHPDKLSLSSENVDQQNENDKIFHPSFQVFAHALVSDNKFECANTIKEFACSLCSKKFGTSLGLTIHQREHNDYSNEFNCTICSKVFHTYNSMTTHYLQAHSYEFCNNEINEETDDEFERSLYEMDFLFSRKCFICFKSFDLTVGLKTMFRKHIIDHHSGNKELLKYFTYICCRCDKPHSAMRSLESHWEKNCFGKWKNEDKANNEIVCEQCGSKVSNQKSLSSHVKIFHESENLVCETCGNQFKNQASLSNHIRFIHGSQYKFTCEHCSKKFKTGFCLKKHNERVHLHVKSYVCKFCSKRMSSKSGLLSHESIHTGERPYECKICKKNFAIKSSLVNHEGIHTGFKCKTCGKTCSSYMDLCEHRRVNHHNPNNRSSELSTSCKLCLKSFKTYMLLNLHKQNVHGKRKYVCEICGKVYKCATSRNIHRISHDNIIRHGCNLCGREFRHATNFYKHRKVVHVNENAQIVNLISKTSLPSPWKEVDISHQIPNLECSKKLELDLALKPEEISNFPQKIIETSQAENTNSPQKSETSNILKHNLEHENTPSLDDYFSDVEFDDQDDDLENSATQFEIEDLRDACPDLANTVFTSHTNDAPNSDDLNEQNSERSSADQSTQGTVTSSQGNVPLGFSELCDETSNAQLTKESLIENKESENQHQVFIEDIEDAAANFLLANVTIDDLVKLKTEKLGEPVDETSLDRIALHSDDNMDEKDGQENRKNDQIHL